MNKKYIKFLSVWLFFIVFCTQAIAGASTPCGANETNCWVCGDDCTARLDSNGKMTVYGSGNMYNYGYHDSSAEERKLYGASFVSHAPWQDRWEQIKSVEISGVTTVGQASFLGFKNLKSVNIGDSVTSIGIWPFEDCNLVNVYIPPTVETIGTFAFNMNDNLEHVFLPQNTKLVGTHTNEEMSIIGRYKQEGDSIYLYDRNGNVKGIFASQSDLKDAILENGQARIEYGEDNSFTVYNKNGEITGKWDSHGDVIARYVKGSDGSVSIYDKFGKLVGIQGKRILSVDEASALVKNNKNTFTLKYR